MRIGIVNTFDQGGGAARASHRLYKELCHKGHDALMLVQNKQFDDKRILAKNGFEQRIVNSVVANLDLLPLKLYPNRENYIFSTGLISSQNINELTENCDVVNINWIAGGFQSINSIAQIKKPVILTLHDSWAYTGGCHVPFDCENFLDRCGSCPQLHSRKNKDLSYWLQGKKIELWSKKEMTVVGGSSWIANNAKNSSVFKNHRVETIHPGLDLEVFKPLDKKLCREILNIGQNEKVILFGAVKSTSDKNKGFHLLVPALKKMADKFPNPGNLKLLVFGASDSKENDQFGIKIEYFGKLYDDISLSVLYSAADVMVVPSLQESFGQTASESFACGTPVVAFDTSGLKDIVDHKVNGFLAQPFNSDDLFEGIFWVLADEDRHFALRTAAREKAVNKFNIQNCTDQYLNLFDSLINQRPKF